ncbi:hypothetical protein FRB99_001487 [Tulasnella sp. 403]|nr:hypothetical protein FRB99_001487 [Tulasnella sp. 403]
MDVSTDATTTAAPVLLSKKRPRLDLEVEPRKKSRSVFGQVFGTLKRARDEDSQAKSTDAVKKRLEIDSRIMGKITRDQTLVRKQDEAKRDRITANRKEEDLAIKDGIMRFRQKVFPRLAGFLLTTDEIPADGVEDADEDKRDASPCRTTSRTAAPPAHPPRTRQPPALYFLPAVLTPAQQKFLDAQKDKFSESVNEEAKEWTMEKKKGLEEVAELRRKANEVVELVIEGGDDEKPPRQKSPTPPVGAVEDKMDVEDKVGEDAPPPAQEEPQREKERQTTAMDTEDTIEY